MSLCNDIYYYLIKYLDLNTFKEYHFLNREMYNMCKDKKASIAKYFLNKYSVDYTDQFNFIYVYNDKSINDYRCGVEWLYEGILKLYMKVYGLYIINCIKMGVTSFPIYPNMKIFYGNNNNMKIFPSQPNMTHFYGNNNNLIKFDVQPNMTHFIGDNNNLITFLSQPNMKKFSGKNNKLEKFLIQPKMTNFYGKNNKIKGFPIQPVMEVYIGDSIECFHTQPKLKIYNYYIIKEN